MSLAVFEAGQLEIAEFVSFERLIGQIKVGPPYAKLLSVSSGMS